MTRKELVVGILVALVLAGSPQAAENRMAPVDDPITAEELVPIRAAGDPATIGSFRPDLEFLSFRGAFVDVSNWQAIKPVDDVRCLVLHDRREIRYQQARDTGYRRVANATVVQRSSAT